MTIKIIDGAQGEGGGQVLRTALTLSMLTGQDIELVNIRAGRKKPGLLRQHLTSVLAAQAVCNASIQGVELGAERIRFSPGKIKAGNYEFAIGSAGSTVLVCQTILPALALAGAKSRVTFLGGTHNGMSPSLSFLQHSFLPVLAAMGVKCELDINSLGFYPAGGGHWQIDIHSADKLLSVHLNQPGRECADQIENCSLTALLSVLPTSIGQREITRAQKVLGWQQAKSQLHRVETPGPGNSFLVNIAGDSHTHVFEVVGKKGLSSERVAEQAAAKAEHFIRSGAAVEEYLADQLLLLMALAGGGSFTTTAPSRHTETNIEVIRQFLPVDIQVTQSGEHLWQITLAEQKPEEEKH